MSSIVVWDEEKPSEINWKIDKTPEGYGKAAKSYPGDWNEIERKEIIWNKVVDKT